MIALPSLLAAKAFLKRAFPFILAAAVGIILICTYRAGVKAERHRNQAIAAKLAAKAEKVARAADALQSRAAALDAKRIANNRKEVDDAIKDIPDQGTSARQRTRACIELRRQAARAGTASPAC